jgi:3-isopropylmalate/(R)-2-methylmalate dehydratase small subunit
MTPFTLLHSPAIPLPAADVDTDIIFPARFLVLTEKKGLGAWAFRDWRFDADGRPLADFVLNRPEHAGAQILVTGPNFGCGSSREHAAWALADLGLRCLIGPSFGEIFQANCHANGLLPVVVGTEEHAVLTAEAEALRPLTVDLRAKRVTLADGRAIAFDLPEARRQALLRGLDDIGLILQQHGAAIADFEARQRLLMPWLADPA